MSLHLPNIRKLFIPDPGYTLFDIDLSGADAQVVAWEAEDDDLKAAFRAGLDVHSHNATAMLGDAYAKLSKDDPRRKKLRQQYKQGVHGTNYGAHYRTIAAILGWTVADAERFQLRWFDIHPQIRKWQQRVERDLLTTRRVSNKFGYSRTYFDRVDGLLPEALAWIPQSTVAQVTIEAWIKLSENIPEVDMLLQVHDSLVFQVRHDLVRSVIPKVRELIHLPVPYDDPLVIPWGIASSAKSWGDCNEEDKWENFQLAA